MTGLVHPEALNEEAFHFVPNLANNADGRVYPIFLNNGITFGGTSSTSWVIVYFDNPGHLSADFTLQRLSRELSHIDYRLRRLGDPEVLKEFRHEPVDDEIALGQTIHPAVINPLQERYETCLVHMLPMDQANHPTDGTCNFINIHWMETPPQGSEGDPSQYNIAPEPIPPIPDDRICYDSRWDRGAGLGLLPRNVFIRHGALGWWLEPSTLHISTSGETLYVNNHDEIGHRFVTTSSSHFGILGAVGGADRELDTGMISPGGQVLIELPTGLPSPYWFNLVEVEQDDSGNITGVNTDSPRIHIMVQNPECIMD
jgi:hypothetical protein